MQYLFIGGVFPQKAEKEIIDNSKGLIQYSANNFQIKILNGLNECLNDELAIISAPFVNPYPMGYKKIYQKEYNQEKNTFFVGFNNIWGIRNISRYRNLKKKINKLDKDSIKELKTIFVYSAHTPFLKLASYLKKQLKNINIVLILPDLPEFMNLSNKKNILYNFLKKIDIKQFYKLSKDIDGYVFLTKYMADVFETKKPYIVVEGISKSKEIKQKEKEQNGKEINVTYTGTLHYKFGVKNLVEAFKLLPKDKYKLHICGAGDMEDYIKEEAEKNRNIKFYGQVRPEESINLQYQSDILVNPRQNIEEFTKYSFPSKNMEYLSTGKPLIAYKLDGIPEEYNKIIFYPKDNTIETLAKKIEEVSKMNNKELEDYKEQTFKFLESKNEKNTAKKIINFIKEKL